MLSSLATSDVKLLLEAERERERESALFVSVIMRERLSLSDIGKFLSRRGRHNALSPSLSLYLRASGA